MARDTTAWLLNGRRETLAARAARCATADKRVAELESELNSLRERLVRREDENHLLQTSLDLLADANRLLSSRLTESDARVDDALSQLGQMKTSLAVAEADRNKLELQVNELERSRSKLIRHEQFTKNLQNARCGFGPR
jgi:chromosome segregation ATPase